MPPPASIDHAAMHRMNTTLVLSTLRRAAPISRAGLAGLTGLNKATVSMIVRTLLEEGLIREIGVDLSNSDVGRPGINLALDPEAGTLIGVEIGVGFISIIATNFDMAVIARRFEDTRELSGQAAILERVLTLLQETTHQIGCAAAHLWHWGGCARSGGYQQRDAAVRPQPGLARRAAPRSA